MKNIVILPFLLFAFQLFSQNTEEEAAVKTVIETLFDGMRAGDSTSVRSVFASDARAQTSFFDKEGNPVLKTGSIDKFVEAVGSPHDNVWDEKIWSYHILIDDNLASVWTEYTFFLGEEMSHCGVNAFHLFKSENGWKITQLTDTRRKESCKG